MRGPGYRSIIANASFLGAAQLATNVARIIYAIGLARLLDAELYGQYNFGLSWYLLFLPISSLGVKWVLSREIGSDPAVTSKLVAHTFAIRMTSALALFALSILLAFYFETDGDVRLLLIIFSFALLGRSLAMWLQSVFVAKESARYVLWQTLIFRLGEVVIGITALLLGNGLATLASVHAVFWITQCALSLALLPKVVGRVAPELHRQEIMRILRKGLPFLAASAFMSWLVQGPMLMFRYFNGLGAELGFLGLALQAFTILGMLLAQLGNASLPVLSRSIDRQDGKSDLYIQEVLRLGWFSGGVLVISALSLGPTLIDLVVGSQYQPVASILPWSLLIVVFFFWTSALQGIVGVHGHFGWVVLGTALGAGIFTTGFFVFSSILGMRGILLAMGAGIGVVAMTYMLVLWKHHDMEWTKKFVKPAVSSITGIVVCWYSRGLGDWIALLLGIASMVTSAFMVGAVTKEDLRLLARGKDRGG